jgi:hypothetical protein
MKKLHRLVALTLLSTLFITSIQGQDETSQEETSQEQEGYSSAYQQSSRTAHWSAYIPLTIIVVAAIYLGIADKKSSHSNYSNSQDGLGSIDSSKRHSSHRSGSCSCKYSYGGSCYH